jgi:hypothetical protein
VAKATINSVLINVKTRSPQVPYSKMLVFSANLSVRCETVDGASEIQKSSHGA